MLKKIIISTGFIVAFLIVVYMFVASPNTIKGNSMAPSYPTETNWITNKLAYRFSEPQRGDVIIFKMPKNPDIENIARIIAIPGDKLMIKDGEVYVNSEKLTESYLMSEKSTTTWPDGFAKEGEEIVVSANKYFEMGDNRPRAADSREWGLIDKDAFVGKIAICYSGCK